MVRDEKDSGLEKLVAIGQTRESAESKIKEILPYDLNSKRYSSKPTITVEPLADNTYLASASFALKDPTDKKVRASGTGAYKSPLEQRLASYRK